MALGHATRTDEAYVFIRQKIIDGSISFGSRLHIDNLAQETGYSITPIREALARLETYGLAESFPHRGVFVVSPCQREVTEMCEGRLCLELYMARGVVQHATEDDVLAMKQASERALMAEPAAELVFDSPTGSLSSPDTSRWPQTSKLTRVLSPSQSFVSLGATRKQVLPVTVSVSPTRTFVS